MRYNSPDNKPISVNIELARERYITGCRLNVPEGEIKDFSVIVSPQKIGKKKTNLPLAIKGDGTPNKNWESELWDNGFTVQNGRKGKFIQIKNHSCIRTNNTFERIQFHIRRLTKYKS